MEYFLEKFKEFQRRIIEKQKENSRKKYLIEKEKEEKEREENIREEKEYEEKLKSEQYIQSYNFYF